MAFGLFLDQANQLHHKKQQTATAPWPATSVNSSQLKEVRFREASAMSNSSRSCLRAAELGPSL